MALPEQIRKQSEAVQELYKQLNDSTDGAPAEAAADEKPVEEAPVAANSDTKNASAPAASEHGSGDDPNSETFAHKYRTLQGMYNAEVGRLQPTNRDLQARMQQMEQLLASLSASQPTSAPAPKAPTTFVSDDDRETYGDSIDVMRKVSREELFPILDKVSSLESTLQQLSSSLNSTVLPQVQRVAQQQAMSVEEKFWKDLATNVPNWQQINNDQGFQSWLLEVDPLTGVTRQTHLEQAQRALDANRVSAFFHTYTGGSGKAAASTNVQPNRSASELEKQVAPGRSRNAGAPAAQTSKMYSPEDIRKFFNDVRQGKYKGREAERDRIERDIFAAQQDGRIVVNS